MPALRRPRDARVCDEIGRVMVHTEQAIAEQPAPRESRGVKVRIVEAAVGEIRAGLVLLAALVLVSLIATWLLASRLDTIAALLNLKKGG